MIRLWIVILPERNRDVIFAILPTPSTGNRKKEQDTFTQMMTAWKTEKKNADAITFQVMALASIIKGRPITNQLFGDAV